MYCCLIVESMIFRSSQGLVESKDAPPILYPTTSLPPPDLLLTSSLPLPDLPSIGVNLTGIHRFGLPRIYSLSSLDSYQKGSLRARVWPQRYGQMLPLTSAQPLPYLPSIGVNFTEIHGFGLPRIYSLNSQDIYQTFAG